MVKEGEKWENNEEKSTGERRDVVEKEKRTKGRISKGRPEKRSTNSGRRGKGREREGRKGRSMRKR